MDVTRSVEIRIPIIIIASIIFVVVDKKEQS